LPSDVTAAGIDRLMHFYLATTKYAGEKEMEKTEKFFITKDRSVVSTCPVSDLFIPCETT